MKTHKLKWLLKTGFHSIPIEFYNTNHGRALAFEVDRPYVFQRENTPDDLRRTLRKYYIYILPYGHRGYDGYHKIPSGEDYDNINTQGTT
jgi:hypothetical protein